MSKSDFPVACAACWPWIVNLCVCSSVGADGVDGDGDDGRGNDGDGDDSNGDGVGDGDHSTRRT